MEDTLRVQNGDDGGEYCGQVLILVLMEDTLREDVKNFFGMNKDVSLNPCFNGRYSQRAKTAFEGKQATVS